MPSCSGKVRNVDYNQLEWKIASLLFSSADAERKVCAWLVIPKNPLFRSRIRQVPRCEAVEQAFPVASESCGASEPARRPALQNVRSPRKYSQGLKSVAPAHWGLRNYSERLKAAAPAGYSCGCARRLPGLTRTSARCARLRPLSWRGTPR